MNGLLEGFPQAQMIDPLGKLNAQPVVAKHRVLIEPSLQIGPVPDADLLGGDGRPLVVGQGGEEVADFQLEFGAGLLVREAPANAVQIG